MESAFAKAISSFLNQYQPSATGVTQEGGITFEFERYSFWNNQHRVHVIVESKLEDLNEALQKALETENYELAGTLRDIIQQRTDDSRREETGTEEDPERGDEPIED